MSKELQIHYPAGATLYALLSNATGSVYNGSTFETFVDANIGNYDIALTEQGTASGFYAGNMPALAAGVYHVAIRERAGASPAVSDPTVGLGDVLWDGSAIINPASSAMVASEISDALTVDVIADSVATAGSRPTIAQALLMMTRFLMERAVTSATLTVKKEDGSTSSMVFDLNSAVNPTSITRAS